MSGRSFPRLGPRKTLAELVYKRLQDNIIHGRLKPGAFLSTAEIAKAMSISSMPVRAALTRLETEGLVTISPQRGVIVANFSVLELEELFIIRSRLEGLAAYLACRNLKATDIAKFRALLREMGRLAKARDAKRWLAANEEWHQSVIRASGSEQLTKLLLELWHRGMPRRIGAPNVAGHMERRYGEHAAILEALENQDGELVERLWRDHILMGGEEIIKFLRDAQTQEGARKGSRR